MVCPVSPSTATGARTATVKRTSVSTYIIDGKDDHHFITKAKAPSTYFFGMWTLREAAYFGPQMIKDPVVLRSGQVCVQQLLSKYRGLLFPWWGNPSCARDKEKHVPAGASREERTPIRWQECTRKGRQRENLRILHGRQR